MLGFVEIARIILAKLVAFLYTVISVFTTGVICEKSLPEKPEDFTPVIRFAVCSDVHLNGDENQTEVTRLKDMSKTSYNYSDSSAYNKLDAVVVVGDFATDGYREEYRLFNKTVNECIRSETQLITMTGNHEYIAYRDVDASVGNKVYVEEMGTALDNHIVINGYHFISVSYCDDGKTFKDKKSWLKSEIEKAIEDSGDKPVFVFQHPAPFGTIYGSINWGDFSISEVLNNYPQVIDFSGHSHYPINDPRSIWQGSFTALGCGTLSYFETELDAISGNFPYDTEQAAQFYIVEADANGNVYVQPYDLITNTFFDNSYYLTDLKNRNFDYSYIKMKFRDNKPVFENASVQTTLNEEGETILTFNGAKDNFIVESYKINLTRSGISVFTDNFSGKYMYLFMEDNYTVNLGKLETGKKYTVTIVAMNAYAECSAPLNYTFTA